MVPAVALRECKWKVGLEDHPGCAGGQPGDYGMSYGCSYLYYTYALIACPHHNLFQP